MSESIAAAPVLADRSPTITGFAWRLAPVGVALASLLVGTLGLGRRSLSTDEAASIATAGGSFTTVLERIVRDDPGQAGHLLLLKLAWAFGNDERTMRAPAAVSVALAAGLMVVLGTMLLGRLGGLVTGIAFAGNAAVITASREARPTAIGLLGVALSTFVLVYALERGGGWRWVAYALVAALLPLTHPLAASVLAAHGAALLARRDRRDLRAGGVALLCGTILAGVLLAWMAADRLDIADANATLDLESIGRGTARAFGWNPVLAGAAIAGIVLLFRARDAVAGAWRGMLVSLLIAAPVVATLLAATVMPVFTGPLVLCAPGIALAAGASTPLLGGDRGLIVAGLAALLAPSIAVLAVQLSKPPDEDWRSLASAVRHVKGRRETVVVIPDRSRAAFAYYAPYVPLIQRARGEGSWIAVVARSPSAAIADARPVVRTPTYALLRQFRYGNGLRLQHWVRP